MYDAGAKAPEFCEQPRFPNNPLRIRVPFFLIFSFNQETPKRKKGKQVLLRHLVTLNRREARSFLAWKLARDMGMHGSTCHSTHLSHVHEINRHWRMSVCACTSFLSDGTVRFENCFFRRRWGHLGAQGYLKVQGDINPDETGPCKTTITILRAYGAYNLAFQSQPPSAPI